MGFASLYPSYGPDNSQHLMHVDNHAVGVAGGGADEQVFHQPAVFGGPGLEPWHGAEIDQFGIDRFAAFQLLQQVDRAEAQALVLDIDDRAIVGLEGVFGFQFDQFVGPDDLEVGAERTDLAVDLLAPHLAACYRNDPAHTGADLAGRCHLADPGGDGEDISGQELRGHRATSALSGHTLRQPQRQDRKCDQDHQPDQVRRHERDHAQEDGRERHVLHHALDHEHIHADRRMNQAKLDRHHDDHAEPDRIEAEMGDDGEDDRHGEDDQ